MKLLLSVIMIFFAIDSYTQTIPREEEFKVYNQLKRIKSYVEPWKATEINIVETDSTKSVKMHCSRSTNKVGDPLVIVDGAIMNTKILNGINPNEIQSVEVLKDKLALDRFGTKAKHGVIIITMKCKEQNIPVL